MHTGSAVRSWCLILVAGTVQAQTATLTVSLRDVNVHTASGYAEALRRIRGAALHLCNRYGNSSRVDDRETRADCMRQSIESALRQLPP